MARKTEPVGENRRVRKNQSVILAVVLVFCLCVGMLAGCQSEGGVTGSGAEHSTDGAEQTGSGAESRANGTGQTGSGTETDDDGTFRIVTSFYPLYIMVMNLTDGIDDVEIANMAEPQTGCLHDYQLRPGDLVRLFGADVFLANGGGMEEFLSDVLDTYPSLTILYALDGVEIDELLPGEEHAHEGHEHAHEGESEEEQPAPATETDFVSQTDVSASGADSVHGTDTSGAEPIPDYQTDMSASDLESGEVNPHTWLNPDLYKQELSYVCAALGEMDPDHREQYEQNFREYEEKIDALTAEYEDLKEVIPKKGCVLLHESFAYLADAFGFPVLETIDVEKDSGFSAKEIRDLIDLVEEAGDGVIFSDSQYSGRISNLLATETGMEVYQLDSCVSGEYDKDAWLDSMRKNLDALQSAAQTAEDMKG